MLSRIFDYFIGISRIFGLVIYVYFKEFYYFQVFNEFSSNFG